MSSHFLTGLDALKEVKLPAEPRDYKLADTFVTSLREMIEKLQSKLEPDQEMSVIIVGPGGREILVDFIGYRNPNIVIIRGMDRISQNRCQLFGHQESIQLLCTREPRIDPNSRRTIGFQQTACGPDML
ncbi:MAG: hypothetical protein ACRD22_07445 [Terriglobia bacterium]